MVIKAIPLLQQLTFPLVENVFTTGEIRLEIQKRVCDSENFVSTSRILVGIVLLEKFCVSTCENHLFTAGKNSFNVKIMCSH